MTWAERGEAPTREALHSCHLGVGSQFWVVPPRRGRCPTRWREDARQAGQVEGMVYLQSPLDLGPCCRLITHLDSVWTLGSACFHLSWGSLTCTFSLSGPGSTELSPGRPSRDAQTRGETSWNSAWYPGAWSPEGGGGPSPAGKYIVCTCAHVCLTREAGGQRRPARRGEPRTGLGVHWTVSGVTLPLQGHTGGRTLPSASPPVSPG